MHSAPRGGQSRHVASVGFELQTTPDVAVSFSSISCHLFDSFYPHLFTGPFRAALVLLLSWPRPQKMLEGRAVSGQDPLGRLFRVPLSVISSSPRVHSAGPLKQRVLGTLIKFSIKP